MTKAEIGRLLEAARRGAGKTQAEMAKAMGTAQPAIARAEAGLRMPSLPFIERWALATGKPIALRLGAGQPQTPSLAARRTLVRSTLGPGRFNPWARNPTPAEADLLEKQGLSREYFELLRRARKR